MKLLEPYAKAEVGNPTAATYEAAPGSDRVSFANESSPRTACMMASRYNPLDSGLGEANNLNTMAEVTGRKRRRMKRTNVCMCRALPCRSSEMQWQVEVDS